jgi:hypothetical protein
VKKRGYRDVGSVRVACAVAVFSTESIHVTGPTGQSADLQLSVPGRITRRFHGRLDAIVDGDELVPAVSMDLETAVASVVAAEQIVSTPPEALKAQAVAARSFLIAARRRHRGFDACDTTHCQFLREPPAADHPAARAARETAGLLLAFPARHLKRSIRRAAAAERAPSQTRGWTPRMVIRISASSACTAMRPAIATDTASDCARKARPHSPPSAARRSRTSSSTTIPGPRWRRDCHRTRQPRTLEP